MPELAKKVTLDLAQNKLFINGEEFPWHISEEGPVLNDVMTYKALRSVSITFYAEDIEVIPVKPMAVLEAEMKVEQTRQALADANRHVQEAANDLQWAQSRLEVARGAYPK